MLKSLVLVGGLSFPLAGNTTDLPDLNCAQIDRDDRTWIICTEDPLDADEIDGVIEYAERIRKKRLHQDHKEKPL